MPVRHFKLIGDKCPNLSLLFNKEDFMKKSIAFSLIVLLMLLMVVGLVFAERRTCTKCNGTGIICGICGASMTSMSAYHCGEKKAITCYICDGKRYEDIDICD